MHTLVTMPCYQNQSTDPKWRSVTPTRQPVPTPCEKVKEEESISPTLDQDDPQCLSQEGVECPAGGPKMSPKLCASFNHTQTSLG